MDCHLLSHGISVEKTSLHDCCLTHSYYGRPFIVELNENNTVDWSEIFALKKSLKNGKRENEKDCKGCRLLSDNPLFSEEGDRDFISHINLNHWNICNARCVYCSKDYNGGDKYFNVLPMMKDLFAYNDGKCVNNEGELTFQGGEPTILPEFEELLDMFIAIGMPVRIHSSGIKYSEAVENGLKNNTVTIIVSPDSAIPETYKKIKNVNCCDKVWENAERYVKAQKEQDKVKIKFIIVPGYNDKVEEIDAFIERSKKIGIKNIIWEIECMYAARYNYEIPHVAMLLDYAVQETEKNNFNYEFYDGAMYVRNKQKNHDINSEDKAAFTKQYNDLKNQYENRVLDYIKIFDK